MRCRYKISIHCIQIEGIVSFQVQMIIGWSLSRSSRIQLSAKIWLISNIISVTLKSVIPLPLFSFMLGPILSFNQTEI